jgi:hypothetical protein
MLPLIMLLTAAVMSAAVTYTGPGGTSGTRATACGDPGSPSGVCAISVTETSSGIGTVAEIQTAADNSARGDTIALQAGVVWSTATQNAVILDKRPGSTGYVTITTSEAAKLPNAGTRITPAYRPVTPVLKVTGSTGPFFLVPSSHEGTATRTPGVPSSHWRFVGLTFEIDTNYYNGGDITRGVIQVGSEASRSVSVVSVADLTVASEVATLGLHKAHGLTAGGTFTLYDATDAALNGLKTVVSVGSAADTNTDYTRYWLTFAVPGVSDGSYVTTPKPYISTGSLITAFSVTGNVATMTTSASHLHAAGDVIGVYGTDVAGLDGVQTITGAPTGTTFTFTTSGVPDDDYMSSHLYYKTPPSLAYAPSDVIIDRCIIQQSTYLGIVRRTLSLHGTRITVRDSFIDGTQHNGSDSQSIASQYGQDHLIHNNYVGSATENIMWGGSQNVPGHPITDAIVRFNYLPHPPERSWGQRYDLLVQTGLGRNGAVHRGRITKGTTGTSTYIATTSGYVNGCGPSGCTGNVDPDWSGCVSGTTCTVTDGDITWRRFGTTQWVIKNNFEFKGSRNALIHNNVFDFMWMASQETAINFKSEQQSETGGYQNNCIPSAWGTVAVSGTTVTSVTGTFPYMEYIAGVRTWLNDPNKITIGGTVYTIASYDSPTSLTVTSAPGDTASAAMSFGSGRNQLCSADYNENTLFANNIVRNTSRPIKGSYGTNSRKDYTSGMIIRNNLFSEIAPLHWVSIDNAPIAAADSRSQSLLLVSPLTNTTIEYNTWQMAAGAINGASVNYGDGRSGDNQVFRYNVLPGGSGNSTTGYSFFSSRDGIDPVDGGTNAAQHGAVSRELMKAASPYTTPVTITRWDKNIFAGVKVDSYSASTGKVYNLCGTSAAFDATKCGIGTADWSLIYRNMSAGNLRVPHTATEFFSSSVEGKSVGVDTAQLSEIRGLTVAPSDRMVLFQWSVSQQIADIPCVAEVGTLPGVDSLGYAGETAQMGTYYRQDADDHDMWVRRGLSRMVVIGHSVPLTASTHYFYRLQCGGDTRTGEFTTLAPLVGTGTLRTSGAGASSMTWGTSYSRATDTISGGGAGSCSDSVCTATVDLGSVVYYRFGSGPVRSAMP